MKKLAAIFLFTCVACSESDSSSSAGREGVSSSRPSAAALEAAGTPEQISVQERAAQLSAEKLELEKLGLINEALCTKMTEFRASCLAKKPITSNAFVTQLACSGALERVKINSKVEVELTSEAIGSFTLKVNNAYESSPLKVGTSELLFNALADDTASTPAFEKITTLDLIPNNLGLPSGETQASVNLNFFVDGVSFFKTTVKDVAATGSYPVNIQGIHQNVLSPACQMQPADMDALLEGISQQVGSGGTAASSSALGNPKTLSALQEQLAQLHPLLEAARNRSFKLKNEVLGGSGSGCHLKENIDTLAITISGSKVRERISNNYKTKKKSEGDAATLDINLGGVSYATDSFIGTIMPDQDFSNIRIGALDRIVLTKKGVMYDNVSTPCKGGVEGFIADKTDGNKCYDIDEEEVMTIDSLKVEANGILLYQKGSLDIKLNHKKLYWEFFDLQSSPEWSQMLQRSDCNSTQ